MASMKWRTAPRTAVRSSTTRSQGLRSLVIGAENYYGAPPKTIVLKSAFFRLEVWLGSSGKRCRCPRAAALPLRQPEALRFKVRGPEALWPRRLRGEVRERQCASANSLPPHALDSTRASEAFRRTVVRFSALPEAVLFSLAASPRSLAGVFPRG